MRHVPGEKGRIVEGLRAVNRGWKAVGIATVLAVGLSSAAQVKVGDNLNMNLNGQASAGYTADYGNEIPSDHGVTFGGNANLTGYYYDPNFLNFNVNPFYDQSRLNSTSASTSNASGVNAAVNVFGGSNFPGSISYSKIYNNDQIFGIPGVANYTANGNSDTFGVHWGVYLPNYPTLSVGYLQGGERLLCLRGERRWISPISAPSTSRATIFWRAFD